MDRNALLDHLAQEMDHWPAPSSVPEPPIKGAWTCHGEWRCYAKGDSRAIEKDDWWQRRLALLNKIEKAPSVLEFYASWPPREDNGMETTPNVPSWPEDRADHIGQNGNDGLHYGPIRQQHEHNPGSAAVEQSVDEHYQRTYKGIKLDPYRIAKIYEMHGGPREQIMKKCLRFTDKGQNEQQVVNEIRSALKRWQEMLNEDAAAERGNYESH